MRIISSVCKIIVMTGFMNIAIAQGSFTVNVSQDTVLMGNHIEVTYIIENINGQFEAPVFDHFQQYGGVRQSTNLTITNGQMNQTQTYTYSLQPKVEGICILEPALLHTSDDILVTDPVHVYVMPNPDGIKQEPGSKKDKPGEGTDLESIHKKERPVTKL